MKYIAILNILIRLVFLIFVFILIKDKSDYFLVPVLMSVGFLISGIASFAVIRFKEGIKLKKPSIDTVRLLLKDSFPIFAKDLITTIKDKFNYLLLGAYVGMDSVVIYDLGSKFVKLLVVPAQIVGTVLFPVVSKKASLKIFMIGAKGIFLFTLIPTLVFFIFLPKIVHFFIPGEIELFPLQLYLTAPLFLALSSFISSNYLIAFGKGKYVLYSIIVTTISYGIVLGYFYIQDGLNNVASFVVVAVIAYFTEFIYRFYILLKKTRLLSLAQ